MSTQRENSPALRVNLSVTGFSFRPNGGKKVRLGRLIQRTMPFFLEAIKIKYYSHKLALISTV